MQGKLWKNLQIVLPDEGFGLKIRMTKKARIIADELERLYPDPKVPLDGETPFTFLIAVLLSAQCTDKRVNEVSPKLFALADTPQKMSKLKLSQIERVIRPCGLYKNKAANIKKLSSDILEKFGGEVPDSFEALESLPGVGHKTASVMMSQVFGRDAFPVDTHIHRLATRWGISDGKSVESTEAALKKFFPKELWNRLHLQLIFYGREYCKAHTCKEGKPFCHMCEKFAKKIPRQKR